MPRRTLSERLAALEQIKSQQRRQRTQELIRAGGLIQKVGLLGLSSNTLYGCLLEAAAADSPEKRAAWEQRGGRAFSREKEAKQEEQETAS